MTQFAGAQVGPSTREASKEARAEAVVAAHAVAAESAEEEVVSFGATPAVEASVEDATAPEAQHDEASSEDAAAESRPAASEPPGPVYVPAPPLRRWDSIEPPAPSPRQPRPSLASRLLEVDGSPKDLALRVGAATLLASTYGLALGAREGGASLLIHAIGVPAALLAVPLLGLPALFILLSFFDAPLSMKRAAGAAVRGIVSGSMVLAGLAPLAALYVVTSGSASAGALAGALGLTLGGALGLRHLVVTLREALATADSATRLMATVSQLGFASFAVLLAWRIWSGVLPLMGAAS